MNVLSQFDEPVLVGTRGGLAVLDWWLEELVAKELGTADPACFNSSWSESTHNVLHCFLFSTHLGSSNVFRIDGTRVMAKTIILLNMAH